MPGISKPVNLVSDCQDRMAKQHPWTCVAHDLPSLGSSGWFVAMNRAVGASRFVVAIGALFQTYIGVVEKALAYRTQNARDWIVVIGAIDADHFLHRQQFTVKVFILRLHSGPAVGIQVQISRRFTVDR
jgi:hypothetical protein